MEPVWDPAVILHIFNDRGEIACVGTVHRSSGNVRCRNRTLTPSGRKIIMDKLHDVLLYSPLELQDALPVLVPMLLCGSIEVRKKQL